MHVHPALPAWMDALEQAFAHCVWVSTWWVQWPWPLPPGQEQPVLIRPDDVDAWHNEREALLEEAREKEHERFMKEG